MWIVYEYLGSSVIRVKLLKIYEDFEVILLYMCKKVPFASDCLEWFVTFDGLKLLDLGIWNTNLNVMV